jgi:hypothetical protein
VIVGALATKTAGILSSSSPHEVFGGALIVFPMMIGGSLLTCP